MPVDRLAEAIAATHEIGGRRGARGVLLGPCGRRQPALVVPLRRRRRRREPAARQRPRSASSTLAVSLGGTVTGEHGIGLVKSAQLSKQLSPAAADVHRAVKRLFDPKNLLNPGKKVA